MKFERSQYPDLPGVYLMRDAKRKIIYVGKAKSIRERLGQYFQGERDLKTNILVPQIEKIEFVVTKNEIEALILESNFIKSYQPKYNIMLKDARHYSYLAITDEKFPRLVVARKNSAGKFRIKARKYFGPFVDEGKRAVSVRFLRNVFKVRICNRLPKKECLAYHLGNCNAPCIGKVNDEEYQKNIDILNEVLRGKEANDKLRSELHKRMEEYSIREEYEKAKEIRDQIKSLDIFFQRQRIENPKIQKDEDFVWLEKTQNILFVQILKSRSGVITKTEKHRVTVNEQEEPEEIFLYDYYSIEKPDGIYTNLNEEKNRYLNDIFDAEVFRKTSKEKEKIMEIARESLNQNEVDISVLKLKEELNLEKTPIRIETFDISTLFGENNVASMVQFVNGRANKKEYRKFIIKSIVGQDDFAAMKEVVYRRYSRLISENAELPDLIVIDGGVGQLHAALEGLKEAGADIQICSLAKQFEEVFLPGKMESIRLDRNNPGLKLLQQGRDDAHRFAVAFNRLRRKKKTFD